MSSPLVATGKLIHAELDSRREGLRRRLRIYLPAAYEQEPGRRFPVLYMHDAQNLFDHPTSAVAPSWGADAALERLLGEGALPPWLVVAVEHRGVERIGDYTPWPEPRYRGEPRGLRYGEFFAEELVPHIDHRLRTIPAASQRAIAGSSLGGLMALFLGWRYPDTFQRIGALSPSVMWGGRRLFRAWSQPHPDTRLYLDVGARERFDFDGLSLDYGVDVRAFYDHLCALGYPEERLRFLADPLGDHSEAAWRRRLPEALRWLLA